MIQEIKEIKEIKRIRQKLGLNQKELAIRAGVSQSLIAKIEAGKLEPTYSKACKIFAALEEIEEKEAVKAKDLMNKKVVFAKPKEKVKEIIKAMKRKGISQMPVLKEGKVCGVINEKIILENIAAGKNVGEMKVEEVMDDSPPIISLNTTRRTILQILKEHSIVLVAEKGEVKGIISKSDVLGRIE